MFLPPTFWYRLTEIVLERGPLNGGCCFGHCVSPRGLVDGINGVECAFPMLRHGFGLQPLSSSNNSPHVIPLHLRFGHQAVQFGNRNDDLWLGS